MVSNNATVAPMNDPRALMASLLTSNAELSPELVPTLVSNAMTCYREFQKEWRAKLLGFCGPWLEVIGFCLIKLHSQELAKLEAGVYALKAEKIQLERDIKEREDFAQREGTPLFVAQALNTEIETKKTRLQNINVQIRLNLSTEIETKKTELKEKYVQMYEVECLKAFKASPTQLGLALPAAWNEYWSHQ